MTIEEALKVLKDGRKNLNKELDQSVQYEQQHTLVALDMAIKALEQEPCDDCISRKAMFDGLASIAKVKARSDAQKSLMGRIMFFVEQLPPVTPKEKTGKCKDCKYFEYDSVITIDGISLIVAHEICLRWNKGCKTKEDGYCFLFEPQESEDKE